MNKKIIIGVITVIVIALVVIGGYFLLNKEKTEEPDKKGANNSNVNENAGNSNDKEDNETNLSNGKTLVVYFSATGSTKNVANKIADNLNADLFEIIPEDVYTSEDLDWTNDNSRVSKEHNDETLRDIKLKNTKVDNWDNYDTVLIGYPIWWETSHYVRQSKI